MTLIAKRDIQKGEELTIFYNNENNYFVNFGFCDEIPSNNVKYHFIFDDHIKKLISKQKDQNIVKLALQLIQNFKEKKSSQFFFQLKLSKETKLNEIDFEFLKIFRLLRSENRNEILKIITNEIPFNEENLYESLKDLKTVFKFSLSLYPTSIEEDFDLLNSGNITKISTKCAILIRKEEKLILKNLIEKIDRIRIQKDDFCESNLKKEYVFLLDDYFYFLLENLKGDEFLKKFLSKEIMKYKIDNIDDHFLTLKLSRNSQISDISPKLWGILRLFHCESEERNQILQMKRIVSYTDSQMVKILEDLIKMLKFLIERIKLKEKIDIFNDEIKKCFTIANIEKKEILKEMIEKIKLLKINF